MYIVTNKIKTKPGFAEKMAPNFTKPGALQQMEGFVKVEVTITQNLTEYDELNVNMYWENLENFEAWKNSDAFKESHKRPNSESKSTSQESPLLGSELVITKVASTIEALPSK
ncbi:heme oxygenase [Psychrobacillus sp. FJAT-21963]|uniref:heme oxygenase n=1 Tax=Psychrobacillus sp. FJAT-21963 TaxID=1712028 RepID=UPI0006F5A343|nr:heme oxygenase [Psychrobacillus sp. FJAT-21963]KQL34679.1 heme-degrading monooxygenase IsdG [Psychrobacillus sp. FJAT-21963]